MQRLFNFLSELLTDHRKAVIEEILRERTRHFLVVAEDTYREHNASALIRTCDAFGIQDINIIQRNYELSIAKGMTQGADKWVDVKVFPEKETDMTGFIQKLRLEGYQIVATSPHNANCTLDEFDITKKSAFFFGREKEGLSDSIIEQSDIILKIPTVGFTESLNISVAAAILIQNLTGKLKSRNDVSWQLSEIEKYQKRMDWYIKSIPNGQRLLHAYLKDHPEIDRKALKEITSY